MHIKTNKFHTLFLGLLCITAACKTKEQVKKKDHLPIYGPKSEVINAVDEFKVGDTIYHHIPFFSFTNQNGKTITSADYKGKIYVADFFFATCPSICPIMTDNLVKVQAKTKGLENFKILSHTVNPEGDSISMLKKYAELMGADERNWDFVRGERDYTYKIAAQGYFQNADVDSLAPGGFLHSAQFTLIDTQGRIRGIYDGTDSSAVNLLIEDVYLLDSLEFKNNH